MKVKVLVLLINYNGFNDTVECLESLRSIEGVDTYKMVLDNGSSDGSEISRIQKQFPEVTCIRSEKNLGFAAGCNYIIRLGLNLYDADFVLLLNNDTVVDSMFLDYMVRAANSDNRIGIVGPKILYYGQKNAIQTTGGQIIWWLGLVSSVGADNLDSEKFCTRSHRDWVSGCALLAKTCMIQKIGLLNEYFFQGGEDYEYCYRALSQGYDILYEPTAIIWHKVSKSSRQKTKKTKPPGANKKVGSFAYINLFRSISPHPYISMMAATIIGFPLQILKYLFGTKDLELKHYYRKKFLYSIGLLHS